MPPTGIMIHIAKECGYDNVKDYLEKYVASYGLKCAIIKENVQ